MSDVSILSHEYKRIADVSQRLSKAVITVKKGFLKVPGSERITEQEVSAACNGLVKVLLTLVELIGAKERAAADKSMLMRLPAEFVARVRAERAGDLDYYLEDLKAAADRLAKGTSYISTTDLEILDRLAAIADIETSTVFRRLMRKS